MPLIKRPKKLMLDALLLDKFEHLQKQLAQKGFQKRNLSDLVEEFLALEIEKMQEKLKKTTNLS